MVFFKTLPFASRPAPFLFSFSLFDGRKQQIGEGDEPRARRFLRVHQSVSRIRVFVFKTLTRSRRAVAAQRPEVEGFSS
jgi:hypothetical protein